MRRFVREQSLSLVFGGLFLAALAGQAIAGWHDYNNVETWHAAMAGEPPETISLGRYVTSSSFAQAVTENWQSEYLQFTLFILLTIWFSRAPSPTKNSPSGPTSSRTRRSGRRPAAGGWRSTRTRWCS